MQGVVPCPILKYIKQGKSEGFDSCDRPSNLTQNEAICEFKMKLQPGNAQFGSKSAIFLSCVTLKFDGWPWKTIGHLVYATLSFVHHFIVIVEFNLELQSGNARIGSKSVFFFGPCDLEIWRMTLANNRVPLLCYFKLCASFHTHLCIKTGVTVRKHPILVEIGEFLSPVTLKFERWSWKTIGHFFYATSGFCA